MAGNRPVLAGTNISSTALVGLTGGAYSIGLSVYDYEWSAALVLVFFCLFLLPSIIRSRIYTMPEFPERRYDRRARLLFTLLLAARQQRSLLGLHVARRCSSRMVSCVGRIFIFYMQRPF